MRILGIRAALVVAATALTALAVVASASAATYPNAVVLVSGYNSASSFTTPDPTCKGQEGDTWSNPDGPAGALRAAGFSVFTAPVKHGPDPLGAPCAPGGTPVPPASDAINSYGANDPNGAALASFLAFLRDRYGVQRVQLVGHSDGGNWSRSAMTQDQAFNGLAVDSLTTLGTPYTGSMVADLGTELRDGKCDFSDDIEQDLCDALLDVVERVYDQMGPTTIEQLTHSYLETWNREQTIGACPVTTIAGTGLNLGPFPFSFYNPSDGLVGKASGQAKEAFELPNFFAIPAPDIPNLQSGGTFPVVHAPSLSFISKANLLNTPAISSKVASIVAGTPADGALCNTAAISRPAAERVNAKEYRVVPFRLTQSATSNGRLGRTQANDIVVASRGAELRCDGRELPLLPLLIRSKIGVALPGACKSGLRVSGAGKSGAMLVGSHGSNELVAKRRGRDLKLRVRGPKVKGLEVELRKGTKTKRVRVRKGAVKLPAGSGSATLIVSAKVRPDRSAVASFVVAL